MNLSYLPNSRLRVYSYSGRPVNSLRSPDGATLVSLCLSPIYTISNLLIFAQVSMAMARIARHHGYGIEL